MKLTLDRLQLLNERERRIKDVLGMYYAWRDATGEWKNALRDALWLDWAEGEYPTAVEEFLLKLDFPLEQGSANTAHQAALAE